MPPVAFKQLKFVEFAVLVKSTGGDFATLSEALEAFQDSDARTATITVSGTVSYGSATVTLTKPVEIVGITTTAKIQLSTSTVLTVGAAGDLSYLTFRSVELERSSTGQILFVGQALLRLIDCTLDNDNTTSEMFDIPQNSTVELTRTSVETVANSVIFALTKYNNFMVFDDCQITDFTMSGDLVNAYKYKYGMTFILRNKTVLQNFQNTSDLGPEIVYDGTSIMIESTIMDLSNLNVTGVAFFSKEMDQLNSSMTLEKCLEGWVGGDLVLGPTHFTLTATATINSFNKQNGSIKGQGGYPRFDAINSGTTIDFTAASGTAIVIGVRCSGITLSNFYLRTQGATQNSGISVSAVRTTFREIYVRLSGGTSGNKGFIVSVEDCIIDRCTVECAVDTAVGIDAVGSRCWIRGCTIKGVSALATITTGISVTGTGSRVQDCNINGGLTAMPTGISVSGNALMLISGNVIQGGGTDAILLSGVTDSLVTNNIVSSFTDGIDSNATSGDNLYHGNNFQGVTNGVNQDGGDDSTAADNRVN